MIGRMTLYIMMYDARAGFHTWKGGKGVRGKLLLQYLTTQ